MDRRWAPCMAMLLAAGCGATSRATPIGQEALPISGHSRLYFESSDASGAHEVTVSIVELGDHLRYELECGHVEPARALASPTTGVVDAATLERGHDVYDLGRCGHPTSHARGALPAFLVSRHTRQALHRHERTILRMYGHATDVGLLPVGRESVNVRIDGRATDVPALHARGGGVELWIADAPMPLVLRVRDHGRALALDAIDTGRP